MKYFFFIWCKYFSIFPFLKGAKDIASPIFLSIEKYLGLLIVSYTLGFRYFLPIMLAALMTQEAHNPW